MSLCYKSYCIHVYMYKVFYSFNEDLNEGLISGEEEGR